MRTFIDVGCGAGGVRAGLEQAGWRCVLAVDSDPDVVTIHRVAFGDCLLADVSHLKPSELPAHDLLVCGLPLTPVPIRHGQTAEPPGPWLGRWVHEYARHLEAPALLFESSRGSLQSQFGYSMAFLLQSLGGMGYRVEWIVTDPSWIGIPQTRPRLTILAVRPDLHSLDWKGRKQLFDRVLFRSLAARVTSGLPSRMNGMAHGLLDEVLADRMPSLGRPRPSGATPFKSVGLLMGGEFITASVLVDAGEPDCTLGEICLSADHQHVPIRSVRYYSRGGTTKPIRRRSPFAYCIGSKTSAAPLFAISQESTSRWDLEELLRTNTNWTRYEGGEIVFRLTPERALGFFGSGVENIRAALRQVKCPSSKKYSILGEMAVPSVMELVARTALGSLGGQ